MTYEVTFKVVVDESSKDDAIASARELVSHHDFEPAKVEKISRKPKKNKKYGLIVTNHDWKDHIPHSAIQKMVRKIKGSEVYHDIFQRDDSVYTIVTNCDELVNIEEDLIIELDQLDEPIFWFDSIEELVTKIKGE